jgi:hypothetical protein
MPSGLLSVKTIAIWITQYGVVIAIMKITAMILDRPVIGSLQVRLDSRPTHAMVQLGYG